MNTFPVAPTLSSSSRIVLSSPFSMLDLLCAHLAEHIEVKRHDGGAVFVTYFGTARADINADSVIIILESADETGLSYLKLMVAEHVLEFSGTEKPVIRWSGDGKIGQLLPYFREMCVVRVGNVTPLMRRIVLSGHNLERFAVGGLHVRLLFPPAGIGTPQWPVNGEDGRPQWPKGDAKPEARIYTIRHIDATKGEITIDMLLHGDAEDQHAPGASFARNAKAGDIIGMTGPFGDTIIDADRYILLGDETALPALARMLEIMPATTQASVFIEISNADEEQLLPSAAHVELHWLHRNAEEASADRLAAALRAHPWPSDNHKRPFIWAGCEHMQAKAIRQFVLKELRLSRDKFNIAAYWRQDGTEEE